MKAHLLTTGTEITSGEVVNSNAAWLATRLEEMGVRVFSHLSIRDQRADILQALERLSDSDILILTGGLGPTSDDITRAVVAEWAQAPLEFDSSVWEALNALYRERQLPVREAHKHQCYFPAGSARLFNPVGTAYGFHLKKGAQNIFVLPGPPRELEGMWNQEVLGRLRPLLKAESRQWVRWTCIGAPESEVAELVEPLLAGQQIEVGYRAQVPYVKVKIFVDPQREANLIQKIDAALKPFLVATGSVDLAAELLRLWPASVLEIHDDVTGVLLTQRLFEVRRSMVQGGPELRARIGASGPLQSGLQLSAQGDEFSLEMIAQPLRVRETMTLPYKIKLASERGRRSACEWSIWLAVRALRAQASTSS